GLVPALEPIELLGLLAPKALRVGFRLLPQLLVLAETLDSGLSRELGGRREHAGFTKNAGDVGARGRGHRQTPSGWMTRNSLIRDKVFAGRRQAQAPHHSPFELLSTASLDIACSQQRVYLRDAIRLMEQAVRHAPETAQYAARLEAYRALVDCRSEPVQVRVSATAPTMPPLTDEGKWVPKIAML